MFLGIVGKKIGMTRVFTEQGASVPVTVVEATPNRVTQIKTAQRDGYDAVQVTAGARRASRVGKAMGGHFAAAEVEPGRGVWEFRLAQPLPPATDASDADASDNDNDGDADGEHDSTEAKHAVAEVKPGAEVTVAIFNPGQKVDVTGRTIGKGFAGVIKRHGFRGGRASHGTSKAHRLGGSIGNAQDPGRVFKGKKMAGHMGARRRVQQGLEVVRVDRERNLLLISGSVPGARGDDVIVRPSVKAKSSKGAGK
ncbi:MAG: 50S ribosomal protein L3 [bacterium]